LISGSPGDKASTRSRGFNHSSYVEIEQSLQDVHAGFLEFVEDLGAVQVCEYFKFVRSNLGHLEIEDTTSKIFPNVKQFAAMARKVHALYQVDKSTTTLPLSLQELCEWIAETYWKLSWSIDEAQDNDILQCLEEFAGPVAKDLLQFHMNNVFESWSDEEKKNMLMKRNAAACYVTVDGKRSKISLEAWFGVVFTDFICKKNDPEFNIFGFLVGFYAHGKEERTRLLAWVKDLKTTGPATRVTCHGNHDSLRLVPARALACRA